jgi:hypothetical protein
VSSLPVDTYVLHYDTDMMLAYTLKRVRRIQKDYNDAGNDSIVEFWVIRFGETDFLIRRTIEWMAGYRVASDDFRTIFGFDTPEEAYELWKANKERLIYL